MVLLKALKAFAFSALTRYGDGADNTIEENSIVFP